MSNEGVMSFVTMGQNFHRKQRKPKMEKSIDKFLLEKSSDLQEEYKIIKKQSYSSNNIPQSSSSLIIQINDEAPKNQALNLQKSQKFMSNQSQQDQDLHNNKNGICQQINKLEEKRVKISIKSVKMLLKQHFIINQNTSDDTSISSYSITPKQSNNKKSNANYITTKKNNKVKTIKMRRGYRKNNLLKQNKDNDFSISSSDFQVVDRKNTQLDLYK